MGVSWPTQCLGPVKRNVKDVKCSQWLQDYPYICLWVITSQCCLGESQVACEIYFSGFLFVCLFTLLFTTYVHHSRSHYKKSISICRYYITFKCCQNSKSTEQCISTALSSYWHDGYVFTERTVNILCKMSRRLLGQSSQQKNMFQVIIILIFLHCQRDHWCKLGWLFFLWNMVPKCHSETCI